MCTVYCTYDNPSGTTSQHDIRMQNTSSVVVKANQQRQHPDARALKYKQIIELTPTLMSRCLCFTVQTNRGINSHELQEKNALKCSVKEPPALSEVLLSSSPISSHPQRMALLRPGRASGRPPSARQHLVRFPPVLGQQQNPPLPLRLRRQTTWTESREA